MEILDTTDNFAMDRDDVEASAPKPNTLSVLSLLAVAAATFSYLGAYAVTNALANAEIIPRISREHDPRLRWALCGFVLLMISFGVIALVFRIVSRRQFRRIDRMNDPDPGADLA
jgi:hypothetical protein